MSERRRKSREEELERELRAHLELEAEELRERGLDAAEARYAARRTLGNTTLVKEDIRTMWIPAWFDHLAKDLRYALRALRNNPGFSAAAILSLALGIGANTAIFTLIHALLLRSLPVPDPAALVQLQLVEMGRPGSSFAYPVIGALANRTDIFAGVCGFTSASFNVNSRDGIERVSGAWVTGGCYPALGLRPFAGRLLSPSDDRPGAPPAAVLSYSYWENQLHRDYGAIGRSITIEGKPVTIVGISPPGFTGANVGDAANLTLALAALPQLMPERAPVLEAGSQWLRVLARMRPDVSMAQARTRLAVVWPRMASIATTPRMNPKRRQVLLSSSIDLVPGGAGWSFLRDQFRRPLLILMAATALVLLIACANFANLLLARGAMRAKEIALRFAIGAGRGRVVRQLLTESVLLSLLGAAAGLALAGIGSSLLVALLSSSRRDPILLDLRPDAAILLFTSAVALATGILFGLVPALCATASGPAPALKGSTAPRTRSGLLPTLVASQVALSLVLLIGAGLFVRTLENLERLDPGFRREGVIVADLNALRAGYRGARLSALYQELLDRFAHLPGVVTASVSGNTPLSGWIWSEPVSINGQPPARESAHFNSVAPRYFDTMGTPLLLGRDFDERDRPGAAAAAIVNEAFVRRYFPDGHPLGQQISIANPRYPTFAIVGVVKDTVSQSLREPAPPSVYLPYFQHPQAIGAACFEVRVAGSLAQTANLMRGELAAKLPAAPVQSQVQTLDEQVRRTLIQERMLAALGSSFGALALLLSAVGLYGLLAYAVARSTNEIGIRLALGAQHSEVLGLVFGKALRLLAIGVAVGIPAAWAASRLVTSMLYGLKATDTLTLLGATAVLAVTALLAALLPALRAAHIDPIVALRYE